MSIEHSEKWHVFCKVSLHSFSGRSSPGPLGPVRKILVVRSGRTFIYQGPLELQQLHYCVLSSGLENLHLFFAKINGPKINYAFFLRKHQKVKMDTKKFVFYGLIRPPSPSLFSLFFLFRHYPKLYTPNIINTKQIQFIVDTSPILTQKVHFK